MPDPSSALISGLPGTATVPIAERPGGTRGAFQADVAGNLYVNVAAGGGSGGTSSTFGAAFPGTGTAEGFIDPSGNMAGAKVDSSGNQLIAGSLTIAPVTSTTVTAPAVNTIDATAETVLTANALRKTMIFQNVGTTRIKLVFGASTPTQSNYHIVLPACGSANDGSSLPQSFTIWLGAVQAISDVNGGLLQVTELT